MTPAALFALAARIGLIAFGVESIWIGIWQTLIYDRLPQSEGLRWLFPWSRRERLRILALCVIFGAAMVVFGVKVPSSQLTTTGPGLLAGISSPFWVVAGIVMVRDQLRVLRRATRPRRQQRGAPLADGERSQLDGDAR